MITTNQLQSRLKKYLNTLKSFPTYMSFWDFDKKDIVLRIYGIRTQTKRNTNEEKPIFTTEVMRYYPVIKKMKSHTGSRWNGYNYGNHKGHLFDRAVKYPSGLSSSYGSYFSEHDPKLININLKSGGVPYKLFNIAAGKQAFEGTREFYCIDVNEIKYYDIWFRDYSEHILTEKELEKVSNYRMSGLKTNLNFVEYISSIHSTKQLHLFVSQSTKYEGLHIILKNGLYKHLEDSFLKKVTKDKEMEKWYINLIKTDLKKAERLNVSNLRDAYKGKDIELIRIKKSFKFIWNKAKGKILRQQNGYNYKKEDITPKQMHIFKKIEEMLYETQLFIKHKKCLQNNHISGVSQEELIDYFGYLEFRYDDKPELPNAIVLDKNWKKSFDLLLSKKQEKENKEINEKIMELAEFIGIEKKYMIKDKKKVDFAFRLPEDITNLNQHGKELSHCYRNNMNYIKRHSEKERVLIFIEKEGKPFATATLHPDGSITQINVNQDRTIDKAQGKEKKLIVETIKQRIYPKLFENIGERHEA